MPPRRRTGAAPSRVRAGPGSRAATRSPRRSSPPSTATASPADTSWPSSATSASPPSTPPSATRRSSGGSCPATAAAPGSRASAACEEVTCVLLENKVAVITGAARGIGRATALVLAQEGARVGLVDLLPAVEETGAATARAGPRAATAVFDIADAARVHEGIDARRQALGPIDILVNNAGIVTNVASVARMTPEAWQREIAVNLSGAFHMIRELIGPMAARKWGRIINVSSVAATGGRAHQG